MAQGSSDLDLMEKDITTIPRDSAVLSRVSVFRLYLRLPPPCLPRAVPLRRLAPAGRPGRDPGGPDGAEEDRGGAGAHADDRVGRPSAARCYIELSWGKGQCHTIDLSDVNHCPDGAGEDPAMCGLVVDLAQAGP